MASASVAVGNTKTESHFRELIPEPIEHFPELDDGGSQPSSPRSDAESEEENIDADTKNFYRMIPEMHNLMRMLNSKKKRRNKDMGKVLSRGGNSSLIGRDVYVAHKQKLLSREINSGCGFDAPPSQPYKPFENGVSFETSTKHCEGVLSEVLNRRKTFEEIQHELNSITEVALDTPVLAKAAQYQRKLFVLPMEKFPKAQVKNKAIEVRVTPIIGDPDLYISIAEPPTEREFMWRSLQEGQDVILIHPDDPNYIYGSYFICVTCTSSACEFQLDARVSKPIIHDDDEIYVKAQRVMYLSIKSCIKGSDHRRRLCAGGRGIQQVPAQTPAFKAPKPTLPSRSKKAGDQVDALETPVGTVRRGPKTPVASLSRTQSKSVEPGDSGRLHLPAIGRDDAKERARSAMAMHGSGKSSGWGKSGQFQAEK